MNRFYIVRGFILHIRKKYFSHLGFRACREGLWATSASGKANFGACK